MALPLAKVIVFTRRYPSDNTITFGRVFARIDDEQVDFHNVLDRPACGADNREHVAQGPIKLLDKIVADQPALRVIADLTRNIQRLAAADCAVAEAGRFGQVGRIQQAVSHDTFLWLVIRILWRQPGTAASRKSTRHCPAGL